MVLLFLHLRRPQCSYPRLWEQKSHTNLFLLKLSGKVADFNSLESKVRLPNFEPTECTMCDHRLPPWLNRILQSSGLLRGVRWFETDVLRIPSSWTVWPLKMGIITNPETSVLYQLTPRNDPEDERILYSPLIFKVITRPATIVLITPDTQLSSLI